MLRESFRDGLAAARHAGWRAPLLAVASYVPLVAFASIARGAALVVGFVLHYVLNVALVRVLGASRREPLPPVPQVDEKGRRVLMPPRPGPPTTAADRSPVTAVRNAWRLVRPAVSLTGIYLLALFGAFVVAVVLSGGRFTEYSLAVQTATVMPVVALFMAFVSLAPQRVGLEGETRVLVAAAHSVRIAKTSYGVLLLLTVVEPLITLAVGLAGDGKDVPAGRVAAVVTVGLLAATAAKVVVTAVSNEVYLRGARLDLPAGPAG